MRRCLAGEFNSARLTERAAIVAKDARQSDDEPIDDASSGASSPDAALPGDANDKARSGPKPKPAIEASDLQGLKGVKRGQASLIAWLVWCV